MKHTREKNTMEHQNLIGSTATVLGIAGGAVLLAPIAAPTLHGIAGIAVVGMGVCTTGSALINATNFLSDTATGIMTDGENVAGLLKETLLSKQKKRITAKEIPFKR